MAPALIIYPRTAFAVFGVFFMFPNKFGDICFSSVKNVIVDLTEIALNLWISFCSVGIITILILPIKYHGYLSISLNHLQFPLSMFNICQHVVLLPP